jgi:predicted SnoaL-like aldol condensation-catalyzing enzyme
MAQEGDEMVKTTPVQNKALVLQAFDTLFNKRDYKAAERYWSSNYLQHSAHIPPGRDRLFNLVRTMPASLKYEPGVIVAENDYVIVHGRFSGTGRPRNSIAVDIVRIASSRSIGTCCRTRRPGKNRRAGGSCSGTSFQPEIPHPNPT